MKDVEQLANTLKNSGLVASMNEALNMAKEMIGTGEKVYNDFQKRSEVIAQKSEELKKQKLGIAPKVNQKVKLEIKEESNPNEDSGNEKENIVINEENNENNIIENNATLNEVMQEEAKKIYEEENYEKNNDENKTEEKEVRENINIKETNDIKESESSSEHAEANVDITEMFDFTKK